SVSVHHVFGNVRDFSHTGRVASTGNRAQSGEDIGVRHCDTPGSKSAHGMAHQINPVRVDLVVAAHFGEHVHDIVLRRTAIHRGGVAPLRAGHREAGPLGFAFQGDAAVEFEHAVLVAAHS